MKFRYDEFFKTVEYKDSILPNYLKYDNWNLLDGFLLLVGLCPKNTVVCKRPYVGDEFDTLENLSSFKNHNYNELPQIYINNPQPLSVNQNFSICLDELGQTLSYGRFKIVLLSMVRRDLNRALRKKGEKLKRGLPEIDLNRKQAKDALEKILDAKESYELNFNNLIGIWFSGDHWDREQDHYPR